MQLSQLFRRGIVLPLDDDSARQLSEFAVHSPVRVEWLPILGDEQFTEIWETGVLQRINQNCGTSISDYEETVIPTSKIQYAIKAIRSASETNASASQFFGLLDLLLSDAMVMNRSVYFVL